MQPQPSETISPEGVPLYFNPYRGTYTASRSYGLRMQRNYARGIQTQQEARGKGVNPLTGLSESQQRRANYEARHGITYNEWQRFYRQYIREINRRVWKDAPPLKWPRLPNDPRIYPEDLAAVKANYERGFRDPAYPGLTNWEEWAHNRLNDRLYAIIEYQEDRDAEPGHVQFEGRASLWYSETDILFGAVAAPPLELWWYH